MNTDKREVALLVAEGSNVSATGSFPKYKGMFTFKTLAVNPVGAELDAIRDMPNRGYIADGDPDYYTVGDDGVKKARITVWVESVSEENNNISMVLPIDYWIRDVVRWNRDQTKFQCINAFGDTIWLTKEQFDSKTLPENQKDFLLDEIRPAFEGEEALSKLIRAARSIPGSKTFNNDTKEWVVIPDKTKAYNQLDNIKKYFDGDISEIKNLLMNAKEKPYKFVVGVRTSTKEDGRKSQFQVVFKECPVKYRNNRYNSVEREITNRQLNGGYPDTDFGIMPFKITELKDSPSDLSDLATETVAAPVSWGDYVNDMPSF